MKNQNFIYIVKQAPKKNADRDSYITIGSYYEHEAAKNRLLAEWQKGKSTYMQTKKIAHSRSNKWGEPNDR